MRIRSRLVALVATSFALAACGGGTQKGGSGSSDQGSSSRTTYATSSGTSGSNSRTSGSGTSSGTGSTSSSSSSGTDSSGSSSSSETGSSGSSSSSGTGSSGSSSSSDASSSSSGSSSGSTAKQPGTPASGAVTVNPATVHQHISGFGASTAWLGTTMSSSDADLAFSTTNGAGLSLDRVRINYEGNGTSAPETATALLAQARGAKVWATPWTPPIADKSNDNAVEGTLTNPSAYATFLVD